MKHIMLGLLSLPLVTACVTAQEQYYAPYGSSPPRVEVYRHAHRPHAYAYEQGSVHGGTHYARRPAPGSAVIVSPRNQASVPAAAVHGHGQGRGIAPQNAHGHNQAARVPQNAHGHASVDNSKVTRHHSEEQEQGNTHGHY